MPRSRLQPFILPTMASASASTYHQDPHVSFDLSPTQQYILDQPPPYHDTLARSSPHDDIAIRRMYNPIATLFRGIHSRYIDADVENVNKDEDEDEDEDEINEAEKARQKRRTWEFYEETPTDKWFTVLCLMLLLSLLFNVFLVFNGPVHCLPHVKHHKTGN